MKTIAYVYSSRTDFSLQDAVLHIMPELWLRKIFHAVVNVNSKDSEKIYTGLTKKELSSLPEDSSDIYKRNMVNRYIIRPSQEKK